MGHLLACTLITILMDWDRSDSSACVTLTGREGGRAEETGVKAGLDEGDYWRGKTTTFGFSPNAAENVSFRIFYKLFLYCFWVVRLKTSWKRHSKWREFRQPFSRARAELFRLPANVHQVTLWTERDDVTRWLLIHTLETQLQGGVWGSALKVTWRCNVWGPGIEPVISGAAALYCQTPTDERAHRKQAEIVSHS